MRIVTRKQHKDFEAAQAVPPQAGKQISTPTELQNLVTLVSLNPAHGAFVDSLSISLRSSFSLSSLRRSLVSLHNLTDLVIISPRLRSAAVFRGVRLPQLQFFRTDLPHLAIVDFLAAHPTVTDLEILGGAHGTGIQCPLQAVDLSGLKHLAGPATCACPLAPQGLTSLTIELDDSIPQCSLCLRSISPPLPSLYRLVVDVRADDREILSSIASACPTIRKLKLVEKVCMNIRHAAGRQAWCNAPSWERALRKLPDLEELLLRTGAPLIRKPGDWKQEHQLVSYWTGSSRRVSRRANAKLHPVLYHIGIWYAAGPQGGGYLMDWSKASGTWERIVSMSHLSADHDFY